MAARHSPYDDNTVNDQVLDLSVGDHTINYFDSYGDGWHGGYWTLINPTTGDVGRRQSGRWGAGRRRLGNIHARRRRCGVHGQQQ